MAHQHRVVDSDIHFTIDPVTRAIHRADAKKSSLVVGDHNSERFTFEIPKIVEGHDMSLCNVIRVHYLNTSSDDKSVQSLGVYEVDDFATDPENEDVIKFSWLISKKATKHVGPLAFTIQFACMTGFKVDYSWQSGIFSGITVSDAVNGAEVVIEEYADILQQWWEQLYASSELPIEVIPFEDFAALEGDTKNGMLYMILDDPAIEDLEKIPGIEQNVTTLITDVDNLKEEVAADKQNLTNLDSTVQTNKENIDNLTSRVYTNELSITDFNSAVQTNKENIDNLTSRVFTNELSITDLNSAVQANEENINTMDNTLKLVQQNLGDVASKWNYGAYSTLYEFDIDGQQINMMDVINGLYIIRAEYVDPDTGHRASTTVFLDAIDSRFAETASTSISFATAAGIVDQYRIGCRVSDPLKSTVVFFPYNVEHFESIPDDDPPEHWTLYLSDIPVPYITLYGRLIYENPIV